MNCKCVEKINKQLEPYNTQIAMSHSIDFSTGKCDSLVLIETESTRPRGKKKQVVVAFCPFCGRDCEKKPKKAKAKP